EPVKPTPPRCRGGARNWACRGRLLSTTESTSVKPGFYGIRRVRGCFRMNDPAIQAKEQASDIEQLLDQTEEAIAQAQLDALLAEVSPQAALANDPHHTTSPQPYQLSDLQRD